MCGSVGLSWCQFHRLQPPQHAHIQASTAFVLFLNFPIFICSYVRAFTCVCVHMCMCSPMCGYVHTWRPEVKLECRSWGVVSLLCETGSLMAWSSPGRQGWSAIRLRDPPVCALPAQRPQAGVSTSHSTHEFCRINLTPHSLYSKCFTDWATYPVLLVSLKRWLSCSDIEANVTWPLSCPASVLSPLNFSPLLLLGVLGYIGICT